MEWLLGRGNQVAHTDLSPMGTENDRTQIKGGYGNGHEGDPFSLPTPGAPWTRASREQVAWFSISLHPYWTVETASVYFGY